MWGLPPKTPNFFWGAGTRRCGTGTWRPSAPACCGCTTTEPQKGAPQKRGTPKRGTPKKGAPQNPPDAAREEETAAGVPRNWSVFGIPLQHEEPQKWGHPKNCATPKTGTPKTAEPQNWDILDSSLRQEEPRKRSTPKWGTPKKGTPPKRGTPKTAGPRNWSIWGLPPSQRRTPKERRPEMERPQNWDPPKQAGISPKPGFRPQKKTKGGGGPRRL